MRRLGPGAVVSALLLVAGLITGVALVTGWGAPPSSSAGAPVAVHPVPDRTVKIPAMRPSRRQPASWPAAGSGVAVVASSGLSRAGALPVWVGPPDGGVVTSARVPRPSRVDVSMAPHAAASALGVHGVVFSIARGDVGDAAGRVHVSLDYASFAHAYGGDYAARLRLIQLPACALTTPQLPACRKEVPLPSGAADDLRTSRVGADVKLPGTQATAALGRPGSILLTSDLAASGSAVVLAATASPSGSAGNYAAQPMSEQKDWVSGGSSGAYAHSYPVQVPPVPGGLEPTVALDYDSQLTDGLTSSTNNEASWAGDGWDYSPGFIEADYARCRNTPDLCSTQAPALTLSMNGTNTTLVADPNTPGLYHAEADSGAKITENSGDWELIEPDGTQYYFGMNQLPGYASGDQATDSVWTVPTTTALGQGVFGTGPWRWNLDYVVDQHSNAIAYFYNTETNYYAENNGTTGTGQYIQGGALARIEYGLRGGNIYSQTPAAQVNFTVATSRQDAPDDLACSSGAACAVTSPTFWSDDVLTGISTQSLVGGSLRNVDSWTLADTYPATGDSTTSPSLWLSSITQTGQDGATPITLPPTSFAGVPMPNRVETAADTSAGYSKITRFRLAAITNPAGEVTAVAYSAQDPSCAAGNFPAPDANTTACYPDYWAPPGSSTQVTDWFNLYAVSTITDNDTTGGDPPVVTSYTYAGAAWHGDDDTVSLSLTPTYDGWRGYRTVTTQVGTPPDPVTEQVDTYLQGMSGDGACAAFTHCDNSVTITSSRGDTVTDDDGFAGMLLESIVYDGTGTGAQITDTVHLPAGTTTATSTAGFPAFMAEEAGTDTYTTLAGGGTRESTVSYTYDSYGRVTGESDVPDTSDPSQATCTATSYNTDTTNWVLNEKTSAEVFAGPCGTPRTNPSAVVSDTLYGYDSTGDVIKTQKATAVTYNVLNGLQYTYATVQAGTYDEYGRVLTSADADNRTTTTAYTPATGAEPTSVQVADPAGLATTTTFDPARDLPLTVTDPASYQTAKTYDALGRETAAWTAGNPASGPATDKYSYTVSNTAPSVTAEQAEQPGGGYLTTDTIADSFGQVRETQQETASGGTDVSDVSFNSDGWKALTSDPYYVSGAPTGTLVAAASTSVPSQTGYVYDGDGRVVKQVAYALGTETWETDTVYGGNYVTVVPPSGGTSTTTFTDGRGLTAAIYQYHTGVPASPADPAADYDKTAYTYTPAQKLATITDAGNNTWSYTYDLLGNQLTQTDPDAGKSTSTYDNAGQLISVTDARGKTISYIYDLDGRKTAEYDTTGGALESAANQLASWIYDTLAKGKLTSSTSYSDGASYTEQVTGYNSNGLSSGTQTTIPSVQGALAGIYSTSDTYAPDGQLTSYTDSAAGGLPAETVSIGYNSAGKPDSLTGTGSYVNSLSYTNLDQPLQYSMGSSSGPAYITDSYDSQTGRLTEQNTRTGTAQTSVDDLHYSYDNFGNVTSEADTPSADATAADVQCFQYDYLGRLAQAWAQGSTGCASTPSASAEGGAAPYWNSYTYNPIGNLTGITATTSSGAVTTTSLTYPAAGAAQPHAVTGQAVTTASGTAGTSYGYDPAGNLTTVSGSSQSQALTWNDAGQLAQDTITPKGGTGSSTSYVYDGDGTLLLTADPGTTTLYLADEELSLNTATGAVTGTRYYSLGDTTVATRTGASSVAYLAGDQQGTDSVAIDSATLDATRRYFDPYGNPRGTAPSSFPTGEKGFVGGAADKATGLTDLGAREYQPATGSFITPDPLLNPDDPQDLNPYAYAHGNPATDSDPTGMTCTGSPDNPQCYGKDRTCTEDPAICQKNNDPPPPPRGYIPPPNRNFCPTPTGSCTSTAPPFTRKVHDHHKPSKPNPVRKKGPGRSVLSLIGAGASTIGGLISSGAATVGGLINGLGDIEVSGLGLGLACMTALSPQCMEKLAGPGCGGQSFTAATKVLLASGQAVPISALKPGDKVLATNVKTGKTQAEPVAAVLVHHDADLYDLRVKSGDKTAVISTTSDHLFWDASLNKWVPAARLREGDSLRTPLGTIATADGGYIPTQHAGWMWDLTIPGDGDHDFYVIAEPRAGFALVPAYAALLVHNDDSPVGTVFRDGPYRFQIYSNDHGPAHGHLLGPGIGGGGIQIGQNGKPLDPNVTLTPAQQKVIDENLGTIRKAIGKYMAWYRNNACG